MNAKMPALVAACTLVLAACGNNAAPTNEPAPVASTTSPEAPVPAPPLTPAMPAAPMSTAVPAASTSAGGKPAAVVTDCSTEFDATDAMQYSIGSIVVPASCTDFKITLKHTGNLPVASMGHDVVITKQADMAAVDAAGAAAGLDKGYLKPDDSRVIAHTRLIGGGETASISFPVSKIKDGGPYVFFCSFPGHSAVMHGTISVQ